MSEKALTLLKERLQTQEQQALKNLSHAQDQLVQLEQRMATVQEYRRQYLDQFRQSDSLSASRIQHLAAFIGKLDGALSEQTQTVARGRQNVDVRRRQWAELKQRLEAIELLLRQRAEQAAGRAHKQEQKMLDEFANARFWRDAQSRE